MRVSGIFCALDPVKRRVLRIISSFCNNKEITKKRPRNTQYDKSILCYLIYLENVSWHDVFDRQILFLVLNPLHKLHRGLENQRFQLKQMKNDKMLQLAFRTMPYWLNKREHNIRYVFERLSEAPLTFPHSIMISAPHYKVH